MASPLLAIANSSILLQTEGSTVTQTAGRYSIDAGPLYLINCYLKRSQPKIGPETGSRKSPTKGRQDSLMPGASGDSFPYRGYMLRYATVAPGFDLGVDDETVLSYTEMTTPQAWIQPGMICSLRFGADKILRGSIEICSGTFGGEGIDETIYTEIGGVPVTIIGGDTQN